MFGGSGNPHPYDLPALAVMCVTAIALLGGLVLGAQSFEATLVRRGTMIFAIVVMSAVYLVTPTPNGIVGAWRLLTLWPAIVVNAVLFGLWCWRVGRV